MDDNEAKIQAAQIQAKSNFRVAVVAGVLGGLIGAAATVAVGWFEMSSRNRALDLEMAKLSLDILAGEYDPDAKRSPLPARRFAIETLLQRAGTNLSEKDKETWIRNGALPFGQLGQSDPHPYATKEQYLSFGYWNRDIPIPLAGGVCVEHVTGVVGCGETWAGIAHNEICVSDGILGVVCGEYAKGSFRDFSSNTQFLPSTNGQSIPGN